MKKNNIEKNNINDYNNYKEQHNQYQRINPTFTQNDIDSFVKF